MTDNQIIDGLLKDKRESLKYVYSQYYDIIRNKLSSMGGSIEDIEDVFQDSIVDLVYALKTEKFRGESKLSTYLFSIAKFKFYNLKKKKKYTTEEIDEGMPLFVDEQILEDEEKISRMQKALDKLDEKCRMLLKSYYYQGIDLMKLSEEMELSYAFIRQKKKRCLNKIKADLKL